MVHILHVTNGSCAFGSWTEVCIQSNIVHCSNYIMNTTRVTVWNMYLMSTTCRSTRARAVVDWIGNTCVCNKVSACLERRSIYNSHNQHTTFDRRLTCAKWSREVTTRGGKASHSFRRNRTGSQMTTLTGKSKKLQVVMGGTQGSSWVGSRFCLLFWEQQESAKALKMDMSTLAWLTEVRKMSQGGKTKGRKLLGWIWTQWWEMPDKAGRPTSVFRKKQQKAWQTRNAHHTSVK